MPFQVRFTQARTLFDLSSEGLGSQGHLLQERSLELHSPAPTSFPIPPVPLDLLWDALKYSGFTDVYSVLFLQQEAMDQGEDGPTGCC